VQEEDSGVLVGCLKSEGPTVKGLEVEGLEWKRWSVRGEKELSGSAEEAGEEAEEVVGALAVSVAEVR
jgi:hypothetical protein